MNTKMKQCHSCGAFMSIRSKKCFKCGSVDLGSDHNVITCPTCGFELELEENHAECAFCGETISINDHYVVHSKYRGDLFESYH
jgi:predicted amidophosphoribosyltransferase